MIVPLIAAGLWLLACLLMVLGVAGPILFPRKQKR